MFAVDRFPYTDPSVEMNIAWDDKWVEIPWCRHSHPAVIKISDLIRKSTTAGHSVSGADRLAMIKMRIPDIRLLRSTDERVTKQLKNIDSVYQPVSKYPQLFGISLCCRKG